MEKTETILYHILRRTYYKLDSEKNGLSYYDVSTIMALPEKGYGLCYAYAQTLREALNYMGIKAYATSAKMYNQDDYDHEIVVAKIDGEWIPIEATTAAVSFKDAQYSYREAEDNRERLQFDWESRVNKYRDVSEYPNETNTYYRNRAVEKYLDEN